MTCRDLTDFLASYLGDDLAPDIRSTFDRHLAACPNCRCFLQQYEQTLAAGQRAFVRDDETPIPDDLVHAILSSLRRES